MLTRTRGHTSNITTGMWHPCDSEVIVTAAHDSSVRFWDVNKEKQHKALVKVKNEKGQAKVTPTAIAIGGDGKSLLIGKFVCLTQTSVNIFLQPRMMVRCNNGPLMVLTTDLPLASIKRT